MAPQNTREEIVAAADALFYAQGFEHTSFSDIAESVRISRGNIYFHFQSKDQVLGAVIDRRLAKTARMLADWEAASAQPQGRIRSFIQILLVNQLPILRHGCPVGTLCAELVKLEHLAQPHAAEVFSLFRSWLRAQFALLGPRDADALAMHVLARSQGIATLASAFHDEDFLAQEVRQLEAWLDTITAAPPASASAPKPTRRPRRTPR